MVRFDHLDPKTIGQRLSAARKARGLTQQDAADHLECSRPTLIAIEKGSRRATADEIIQLAELYSRSVHELVRPGQGTADLQPHLRAVAGRMKDGAKDFDDAIDELQRFADDYRDLERIMQAPLRFNYPPEVRLTGRVNAAELGEDIAIQERRRLGLGDQPVHNLRSILELDVGLRILYGDLPSQIAGMYAFSSELGCCILINRKHPGERRRASLLHEYGHLIVDRFKPGIDYLTMPGRKPANERFAEAFAMSFLMPASSIRRRFNDIVSTTGDFQVANLCRLSHFYFVSVEAITLRLEKASLIPKGTWEHLKESGLKVLRAKDLLDLPSQPETKDRLPERYKFLAVQAYEQAKITEGQLARFLRCDRVTAREIVAACLTTNAVTAEGQAERLQPADSQRSLLADS